MYTKFISSVQTYSCIFKSYVRAQLNLETFAFFALSFEHNLTWTALNGFHKLS